MSSTDFKLEHRNPMHISIADIGLIGNLTVEYLAAFILTLRYA